MAVHYLSSWLPLSGIYLVGGAYSATLTLSAAHANMVGNSNAELTVRDHLEALALSGAEAWACLIALP